MARNDLHFLACEDCQEFNTFQDDHEYKPKIFAISNHEAPEDIEYYFCGPPMMNQAVLKMCDDWGVPPEQVRFDDFGG